jgi:hypothetical protein
MNIGIMTYMKDLGFLLLPTFAFVHVFMDILKEL